jgi:hypothetical protein
MVAKGEFVELCVKTWLGQTLAYSS